MSPKIQDSFRLNTKPQFPAIQAIITTGCALFISGCLIVASFSFSDLLESSACGPHAFFYIFDQQQIVAPLFISAVLLGITISLPVISFVFYIIRNLFRVPMSGGIPTQPAFQLFKRRSMFFCMGLLIVIIGCVLYDARDVTCFENNYISKYGIYTRTQTITRWSDIAKIQIRCEFLGGKRSGSWLEQAELITRSHSIIWLSSIDDSPRKKMIFRRIGELTKSNRLVFDDSGVEHGCPLPNIRTLFRGQNELKYNTNLR
jgi:hypothetical protein